MRGLVRVTFGAVAGVALSATGVVLAQGPAPGEQPPSVPVRLEYRAPPACPDVDAFFAAVRARTERVRRAQPTEEARTFVVVILSDGQRTFGRLQVTEGGQETDSREVEGANCAEVAEALSLTAALSVDPEALVTAPEQTPPAELESQPAPPPPPPTPPAQLAPPLATPPPASLETQRRPAVLRAGLAVTGATVLDPYLLAGGSAFIKIESPAPTLFAPSVRLAVLHTRNDVASDPGEALATWSSATLDGCPVRFGSGGLVNVQPCARAHVGLLYLRGLQVDHPRSATRTWYGVGAIAQAQLELGGGFAIELQGGLLLSLVERSYSTREPLDRVAHTPWASAFGSLGLAAPLL